LVVSEDSGPYYCHIIDIAASSSNVARFARVFASNRFASSPPGLPTPRFTIGSIRPPGPPINVLAVPTDAFGILVTWMKPDSVDCSYGGDGGAPVSYFVVEWDTRADFGSPATRFLLDDASATSYQIGGRNILTGKKPQLLQPGVPYYVRVTAFNSKGAGIPGYAAGPIFTSDEKPQPPRNLTVSTYDANSLFLSWNLPVRDGGETLEKYRVRYSSSENFSHFEVLDLPVVHEVQTVVAESDVIIERQAIRVVAEVYNEIQVVRSEVNGTDEVQTVTVSCDDVTNEVQRITTNAVDIDEVQTIELTGTDVDEVQLIQTYTQSVPEVQVVEIISERNVPIQTVGVILSGIDTDSCTVGQSCSDIENQFSGYFRLHFNPNKCGTSAKVDDSNWCIIALKSMGISSYSCSDTTCLTDFIKFGSSAADVENALCSIKSSGGVEIMKDANDTCVTVAKNSYTIVSDGTNGAYVVSYNISFDGAIFRGKIPALNITGTNVTFAGSTAKARSNYTSGGYYYQVGLATAAGEAFIEQQGNQPDGSITLTYLCEASTRSMSAVVSTTTNLGDTITVSSVPALSSSDLYQYVRLGNSYSQIVSVSGNLPRYLHFIRRHL